MAWTAIAWEAFKRATITTVLGPAGAVYYGVTDLARMVSTGSVLPTQIAQAAVAAAPPGATQAEIAEAARNLANGVDRPPMGAGGSAQPVELKTDPTIWLLIGLVVLVLISGHGKPKAAEEKKAGPVDALGA